MSATSGDELRPVTALFADIVGSTSLGERLSADEIKALIGECVSRMSAAVEEAGGTIQAYAGDGICAYFGVPAAHEDDPERAAEAALGILTVAREYARDVEAAWGIAGFDVRVGINTGQTGVGLVGATVPGTVALGDTTNVAARLEGKAEPGTILVGPETARRLTRAFVLEPLGEFQLKGRAEPVPGWKLIGPRAAAVEAPPTPLFGRHEELLRLETMVEELRAGRGQILLVVGEAGIGKTRLLAELRSRTDENVTWLKGTCPSYGTGMASGAGAQAVRSWLRLDEGDPEVVVRMRLKANLTALLDSASTEILPALGQLLGLKFDQETSAQPARALPQAFEAWVEALAVRGPVIVVFDSLQWADPTTFELTEALLELTDREPVMVIGAFRPDPSSRVWPLRTRVLAEFAHRATELWLAPLDEDAGRQLVDLLLPPGVVDDLTKQGVVKRSEGNPLFLEELARNLQTTGTGDRSRSWSVSIRDLLPSSLGSLMVSRIDRLPEGPRRLIQAAAVIGRTFSVPVLEHVVGSDGLSEDLAVLFRADLVREVRRYPALECTFRHGLVQEAALETLTRDRLRELNGRVAAAYEELSAGSLGAHIETLAYHYYRSNDHAKALAYLERAAGEAMARGARAEGIELLRRAQKAATRAGDEDAAARLTAQVSGMEPAGSG